VRHFALQALQGVLLAVAACIPVAAQERPPEGETGVDPASGVAAVLQDALSSQDPAELTRRILLSLLLIGAALALRAVARRLIDRAGERIRLTAEEVAPLAARARRIESGAKKLVTVSLMLVVLLSVLRIWGLGLAELLFAGTGIADRASTAVLILLASWLAWYAARLSIEFLLLPRAEGADLEASARTRTLVPLFIGVSRVVISVTAVLLVLSELGLDIAPLLAGAGIAGLAIGFGAQTLVKDFLTGAFIILEDSISVGDVASVAGHTGVVEAMGVRTMRLRDLAGTVHTVPYSEIGTIQNLTKDFSFAVFDIGVAYHEDIDRVIEVMIAVAEDQRADPEFAELILEPMEVLGLDQFGDSAVVVKARIKTRPIRQWAVKRDYNRRLKRRFDAEGIEIPFPHRTLYFGVDKAGTAPPARLALEDEALAHLANTRKEPGLPET